MNTDSPQEALGGPYSLKDLRRRIKSQENAKVPNQALQSLLAVVEAGWNVSLWYTGSNKLVTELERLEVALDRFVE